MQKRVVGKSGIAVSVLGLGTVKFGRNQGVKYPATFELPSDSELEGLLSLAKELGINLLDTAPAYGISEQRLGALLKGRRHDWVISTKVGEAFNGTHSHFDFSKAAIHKSINRSLQALQTDYLDIVLVHSNGEDCRLIEEEEVFTTLAQLKNKGMIRAYGMSTKTKSGGLLTAQIADVVMMTYHPLYTEERPVIHAANAHQTGVFIKKALASGHLQPFGANPIDAAMRFILEEAGVTSVIIGTINAAHLRQNAASVMRMDPAVKPRD